MNINDFCSPALLYVAFSITHIIVDLFKRMYNTALVKFIVMIIFTFLLNLLCQRGLTVISWIIVFVPFITMTVITTLLLIIFGLSPFTGKIDKTHLVPSPYIPHRDKPHHDKPHHHSKKCKDKQHHHKEHHHKEHHHKEHHHKEHHHKERHHKEHHHKEHHDKFYN